MKTIEKTEEKLIYPELSYKIIGILFEVHNQLGGGYQEKYYQRAIEKAFDQEKIKYQSQCPVAIKFKDNKIGCYYIDFLVDNKIILEIKKGNYFSRNNIGQVNGYLKSTNKKLAILANFTSDGVKFRRILNLY